MSRAILSLIAPLVRGAAVCVLLIVLAGCSPKAGPDDAAKQFFGRLAAGEAEKAYSEGAFTFQAQQTPKAFAQSVKELGLSPEDSYTWDPPEITGDEARTRVEVAAKSGRKLTFIVTLVRESGAWRVHSLRNPRSEGSTRTENRFTVVGKGAAFSDAQSQRMPEEAEIKQMILTTLAKFDEAVQQKSFGDFYTGVSIAWQKQLTVGQLERAFAPFINAGVRIGGLNEADMQLDGPPMINTEGILVINGHFNTAPYRVYFGMKFVYELPHWKLFGLDVNLQK